jgi:hypothetical protein
LQRIDISRSVAVGTSIVDGNPGGPNWQAQTLLRALRAGEPLRIALSLSLEAVHSAARGRVSRRRTARLIRDAEALAQRLGHPQALGMATLSAGCAAFLEGRFAAGLELLDLAAACCANRCAGVVWELDTAHIFGLWSLTYLGRSASCKGGSRGCSRRAGSAGIATSRRRSGRTPGRSRGLAADEVEAGAGAGGGGGAALVAAAVPRPAPAPALRPAVHRPVCRGRGRRLAPGLRAAAGARRIVAAADPARADRRRQLRGRCAVAAAAGASDPRPLLHAARSRPAASCGSACVVLGVGDADPRRGGVGAGDAMRAATRLAEAAAGFEAVDMGLFAAAARRQLGGLRGGEEGRGLVAAADAWMAGQAIRDPARMAACLAPDSPIDKEISPRSTRRARRKRREKPWKGNRIKSVSRDSSPISTTGLRPHDRGARVAGAERAQRACPGAATSGARALRSLGPGHPVFRTSRRVEIGEE